VNVKKPNPLLCFLYKNDSMFQQPIDHSHLTAMFAKEAKNFITTNRNNKFFLYVAFAHVHVNMFTSPRFKNSSVRGVFGDNIREMDWAVGEIMETIRELDLEKKTLVFFTSDSMPF